MHAYITYLGIVYIFLYTRCVRACVVRNYQIIYVHYNLSDIRRSVLCGPPSKNALLSHVTLQTSSRNECFIFLTVMSVLRFSLRIKELIIALTLHLIFLLRFI